MGVQNSQGVSDPDPTLIRGPVTWISLYPPKTDLDSIRDRWWWFQFQFQFIIYLSSHTLSLLSWHQYSTLKWKTNQIKEHQSWSFRIDGWDSKIRNKFDGMCHDLMLFTSLAFFFFFFHSNLPSRASTVSLTFIRSLFVGCSHHWPLKPLWIVRSCQPILWVVKLQIKLFWIRVIYDLRLCWMLEISAHLMIQIWIMISQWCECISVRCDQTSTMWCTDMTGWPSG